MWLVIGSVFHRRIYCRCSVMWILIGVFANLCQSCIWVPSYFWNNFLLSGAELVSSQADQPVSIPEWTLQWTLEWTLYKVSTARGTAVLPPAHQDQPGNVQEALVWDKESQSKPVLIASASINFHQSCPIPPSGPSAAGGWLALCF